MIRVVVMIRLSNVVLVAEALESSQEADEAASDICSTAIVALLVEHLVVSGSAALFEALLVGCRSCAGG